MLLKDMGRYISLACLHGRFSADSFFSDFVRWLSMSGKTFALLTCCVRYAFILQSLKYQNPVSLWNKLNKTLQDKEGMFEKGHISYGLCGCNSNSLYHSPGLSAQSLMSKANCQTLLTLVAP